MVTSLYTKRIPTQYFWWGLQLASAALMTFLGMWACQWRELKPIAFGGKASRSEPASAVTEAGAEQGQGFTMGSGSRGRDGAGVYEMIGMGNKDEAV